MIKVNHVNHHNVKPTEYGYSQIMTADSLQLVVGRNVRRLREQFGIRQDDLARETSKLGLKWGASRIGELEHGRLGLSVAAFLILASSLSKLTGQGISLADLVAGDSGVSLTGNFEVSNSAVQSALWGNVVDFEDRLPEMIWRGEPVTFHVDADGNPQLAVGDSAGPPSMGDLATQRASRRTGIPPADMDRTMRYLFGRSLSEERDLRAGPDATKQKRGAITRELTQAAIDELTKQDRG